MQQAQYFRFHQEVDDWWIETKLTDLAIALSRSDSAAVRFEMVSQIRNHPLEIVVSTFASSFDRELRFACQTADVLLRTLGTLMETDRRVMRCALRDSQARSIPRLAEQLLCALEDARLARAIAAKRPGTTQLFRTRSDVYVRYLQGNQASRLRDGQSGDVVFGLLYALCHATNRRERQGIAANLDEFLQSVPVIDKTPCRQFVAEELTRLVEAFQTVTSTQAVVDVHHALMDQLQPYALKDSAYRLFAFEGADEAVIHEASDVALSETRVIEEESKSKAADQDDAQREQVDVWTERQDTKAASSFKMNLDSSDEGAGQGEDAQLAEGHPESVTTRRGDTQGGDGEDQGEDEEWLSVSSSGEAVQVRTEQPPQVYEVPRESVSRESVEKATLWANQTRQASRRLVQSFERSLLHQQRLREGATKHGRLDKRIVRAVTDERPRLFYHKRARGQEFDVAMQILVDCSGSMYRQLEALKPILFLFHETCRRLRIPHDVCGFWEDTRYDRARQQAIPMTHLFHVIPYAQSHRADIGASIDLLEPQLDNRDGLAIREVGKALCARRERQKWLIVLSDGEPAAQDYRDAVIDTKNAVRFIEGQGVHVVHLCMSDAPDTRERLAKMYGTHVSVIDDIDQLPRAMERLFSVMFREIVRREFEL